MSDTLAPVKPGKLIINGEAVDAASGATFTTMNPATEAPVTTVAEAGVVLDRLHEAAEAAGLYFPLWFGARGSATKRRAKTARRR